MLKDSKVLGIAVACCTTNHCFTNSFWLSAGVKQHPHRHDGLRRKRCAYDSVDHGPSTCQIRVMPVMPVTVCLQISQFRFAQNDDLWDHPRIFGERGIRGIFAILSRFCHRFSKFSLGKYFQVLTNSCDCKAKPLLPRILHSKCQVSCSVNKSYKSCCNKIFKPQCYRRQSFSCRLQIIRFNSCWICPQCELWIVIVSVAFTAFFRLPRAFWFGVSDRPGIVYFKYVSFLASS